MADRVMFIGWGQVVRGRERRALEVFGEGMAYYADAERDGRIARFDGVLLGPNRGVDGFWILYGDRDQFAALHEDDEFQRIMLDASLIVDDLQIVDGYTGDGIAEQIGKYADAISNVPQAVG